MSHATTQTWAGLADKPPIELPHPVRMRVLGAVMVGVFLGALDQTVVGTALPRIITDLGGNGLYTWAFTAYLLTSTISGPIYGKLSDLFGRRPVLMFGISVFMVGSLLAGLSNEMWQLVAARGVQGLGAGALFPVAMAVIADLFAPSERGRYQGLFGAVFGLSSLIGPAIGGLLTDTVGWPFVFFVNIPIGIAVLLTVRRYLPAYHPAGARPRIDYLGAALFTGALVPILVGLTNKQSADWVDPTVGGLILLGLVILAGFVFVESRAAEPIVPLGLFRNRAFTVSVASVFLAAFGFLAAVVFLPRWFQVVGGASATISGYQMLPLLGGVIVSAIAAGQVVARTGRYRLLIFSALVLVAAGLAMLTQLRADTPLPLLYAWMFVMGLGMGPVFSVFALVVQNSVPVTQIGAASSNLSFFQQVGGTVGLAITGTVFASTMGREVPGALSTAGVPPGVGSALAQSGATQALTGVGDAGAALLASLPADVRGLVEPYVPAIVDAIHSALSIAIASTFVVGIGSTAIAACLVLLFRDAPAVAAEHVPEPERRAANDREGAAA
ncbi:MAG TPA: MDR family MFS transporter [Candidatus Limnocylindrales bacterium]|nr:MDR family MFS transporter [Candidatus Limnocylindrales bacterium]